MYDSYTKLCSSFNGADGAQAYTDPIAGAYAFNGSAQLDTAQKVFGTASLLLARATGDFLTIGGTSTFNFLHALGTDGKWTIDFRFKAANFSNIHYLLDSSGGTASNTGILVYMNTNRTIAVRIYNGSGTAVLNFTTTGTFPNDTDFHHIEITYDQSLASGNCIVYVDGTALAGTGTKTAQTPAVGNATYALTIGGYSASVAGTDGWIDELRISNTVRHTANFTPPTSEYSTDFLIPTKYTIELRNDKFDLIGILTKKSKNVSWTFNRLGGCGSATVDIAIDPDIMQKISSDYDIRIYAADETGSIVHRYSGYIDSDKPMKSQKPSIKLQINGYSSQLKRARVNYTYENIEASEAIKHILDNYIVPKTAIIYDSADIEATNYVIDSLPLDSLADSAINTLSALAGNYEWGVDLNRKFYFKSKDTSIRHYLRLGKEIKEYDLSNEYGEIKNRLVIKGGTVNDVQFEESYDNVESQSIWKTRIKVLSNSSIVTASVGQQYATSYLAENAIPKRSVSIPLPYSYKFFESTLPIGKVCVIDKSILFPKKYGDSDAIYGQTFKYGGEPSFQVEKIKYSIEDKGMSINVEAGLAASDIAYEIKKLEHQIEQLQNT